MIEPSKLPPSNGASKQHCMRVYFQCLVWKTLSHEPIDPSSCGWKIDSDIYTPITTVEECAPTDLLQFIRCGCKAGCTSNMCSCKKHGLRCVPACKHCCGDCENHEVIIEFYFIYWIRFTIIIGCVTTWGWRRRLNCIRRYIVICFNSNDYVQYWNICTCWW